MAKVIVIGNGIAGLSAALSATENGAEVTIISYLSADRSQSVMAAGGINASLNINGEDDSCELHYNETIKSGCGIADNQAVSDMTKNAPDIINYLIKCGTIFSIDNNNNVAQRYFGGQTKKRTAYSNAGIGKQLVNGLSLAVRKYECEGNITQRYFVEFQSLIMDGENAVGVCIRDTRTRKAENLYADSIIVATGGTNGLFERTTGSILNSGYATAVMFRQGAELSNMEMVQYHPTTLRTPQKQILVSEACRGEGGRLFVYKNNSKYYFMEDMFGERGNLMTRDVISLNEYRIKKQYGQVYLDMTELPSQSYKKLAEIADICKTYVGLDIKKDYIPVEPCVHYFMGGLFVDRTHRTTIPNVFAAGECTALYHGANRLGGNSTLGAIYGGFTAGKNAAQRTYNRKTDGIVSEFIKTDDDISKIYTQCMGVERDQATLADGISKISQLDDSPMKSLALAGLKSAEMRKETRGANIRCDYPDMDKNFECIITASYAGGKINVVKSPKDKKVMWK